jgi:hypothetical protein
MVIERAISQESGTTGTEPHPNAPAVHARDRARPPRALRAALPMSLVFVVLVGLLPARAARADDDATTAMARERFKEGVQYFDKKEYDKSRAAFLQAYALKRHPAVLLNLAQSELRSGHEAEAAKHFAQYLREVKDATDNERQSAESGLSASKAVVAEVTVNVDEEGATVAVDGTSEGQSPLPGPIYLTPGSHTITAKKEARDVAVQVNAVAGQTSSTSLRFKKTGATPPVAAADGEPAPKTEKEAPPATPEAPSAQPGGASAPPANEPERRRQPFFQWATTSPFALIGGSVAAVGLGSGIGFAFAAKHSYDNADSAAAQIRTAVAEDALTTPGFGSEPTGICGDSFRQNKTPPSRAAQYVSACKKYRDNVDTGDTFKVVSTVGWVVAGVAVAGTVVAYLVDGTEPVESASKKPSKATATVTPWLSGTERGLFVSGSF